MAASTYANLVAVLKELYPDGTDFDVCFKTRPLLGIIPKINDLGGKALVVPIKYGITPGRSATLTTAQGYAGVPSYADWLIRADATHNDIMKDYGVVQLDRLTMKLMEKDRAAFVKKVQLRTDAAFEALSASLSAALFNGSTGVIGVISSVAGSTPYVCTLTDVGAANKFELGMYVWGYDATISGSADWVGHVVAVDRSAGKVSITKDSGSQVPDTTYINIMQAGDLNAKIYGLIDWCPDAAPSSAAFLGVDRSVDSRLGGSRLDASAYGNIGDALMDSTVESQILGGDPKVVCIHPKQFVKFAKELRGNVTYSQVMPRTTKGVMEGVVGFKAIKIVGATGECDVLPDKDCGIIKAWTLNPDTGAIHSAGEVPEVFEDSLTLATVDGSEFRAGYYAQTVFQFPGEMVNTILPAL